MMAILFEAERVKKPILKYRNLSIWIKNIIMEYNFLCGKLTYIFCDDDYLLDINNRFLKHDFYTDIVTFDYSKDNTISGDLFISVDRVKDNSVLFNVSVDEEFLRVIVHGLLHLLGYRDSSMEEKNTIRELENKYILLFKNIENGCFKSL